MAMGDNESEGAAPPGRSVPDRFGKIGFFAAMRARNEIRRICVESLRLYRQIEAELPDSSKMERYVRVVERRSGADPRTVVRIMRRAEESFASWPVERPLIFRDVVQYIAVTDCLKTDIAISGVHSELVDFVLDVVSALIPSNL